MFGALDLPDAPDDLICRMLQHHGEWAWTEIEVIRALLPHDARVIDAGACLGTFSLGIATDAARIVAVEPQAGVAALLRRNLARNCPVEWVVEVGALGDRPGTACLTRPPGNIGAAYLSAGDGEVACTTLAALRRRHGDYDALKLDVEGAELSALRGDARWIRQNRPLIWAECNESEAAFGLLEFARWAGLDVQYCATPACRAAAFRNGDSPLLPVAHEAALIMGADPGRLAVLAGRDDIMLRRIDSPRALREALWLTPREGLRDWAGLGRVELLGLLSRYRAGQDIASWLENAQE